MKIIHNKLHKDDIKIFGKDIDGDPSNAGYTIGDALNMPFLWEMWNATPHNDDTTLKRFMLISENYKNSIVYYYNKHRPRDEPIPNIQRICNAVDMYSQNHDIDNDFIKKIKSNHILCVHIRSGDLDVHPKVIDTIQALSQLYEEVYIFSGIHLDQNHRSNNDKISSFMGVMNNLLTNKKFKLLLAEPDIHMVLMREAKNLFVHRGGYSALGAILCKGNVFASEHFGHMYTEKWKHYVPRFINTISI